MQSKRRMAFLQNFTSFAHFILFFKEFYFDHSFVHKKNVFRVHFFFIFYKTKIKKEFSYVNQKSQTTAQWSFR